MGATKSEIFTKKQNQIARISKVLGHPARVAILAYLANSETCICGDLVNEIGLAQATVSQHLKELKKNNFIQGTIEGTSVCYCINKSVWKEYQQVLNDFFTMNLAPDSCCEISIKHNL